MLFSKEIAECVASVATTSKDNDQETKCEGPQASKNNTIENQPEYVHFMFLV